MMSSFPELAIGGVLMAPFVTYAGLALALYLLLRPVLRLIDFDRFFSNPPAAQLSIYVLILALLLTFF